MAGRRAAFDHLQEGAVGEGRICRLAAELAGSFSPWRDDRPIKLAANGLAREAQRDDALTAAYLDEHVVLHGP